MPGRVELCRRYCCSDMIAALFFFTASGITAGSFAIFTNEAELSLGIKSARAVLTLIASAALNYFIAKGLWDIEKISQKQSKDLYDLDEEKSFKDKENELGSTLSAKMVAYIGIMLSAISLIANTAETGRTIGFYLTRNDALIQKEWGFTVLLLTNTVNLIGFILFNVLGRRNADYLAAIVTKKLAIETDKVTDSQAAITKFIKENQELKKRLADRVPAEPALVTEVRHSAEAASAPASTSAAGTGLPIATAVAAIIANPLLGDAASPPSSTTPGAE